jgi:putative nucleotidyltransferase with HDIG domain
MDSLTNDISSQLVNAIDGLPVLSPLVSRIGATISNPDSSADQIVSALKQDPLLSGRVLKLSNSAYVGIPNTISSVKNAVVLLGRKRVYSLVLASGVSNVLRDTGKLPFPLHNFWRHSITVATIAESIAKHLRRYEPIETEDVFTAGLLHDIGRMVLGCFFATTQTTARDLARKEKTAIFEKETQQLSHAVVGRMLAVRWSFPQALTQSIAFHHVPEQAGANAKLASIVHLADILAHIIGANTFDFEQVPVPAPVAQTLVKLPPERLKVIADETLQNEKILDSLISFLA